MNKQNQPPWWSHYEAIYYGQLTASEHELFLSQLTSRMAVENASQGVMNIDEKKQGLSSDHFVSTALVFGQLKHINLAVNDAH